MHKSIRDLIRNLGDNGVNFQPAITNLKSKAKKRARARNSKLLRKFTWDATDDQFNLKEIKVKAGQRVRLTLRHIGKLDVNIMGHNFVLLKKGTDLEYAQKVATHLGTNHTEVFFTPEEGFDCYDGGGAKITYDSNHNSTMSRQLFEVNRPRIHKDYLHIKQNEKNCGKEVFNRERITCISNGFNSAFESFVLNFCFSLRTK